MNKIALRIGALMARFLREFPAVKMIKSIFKFSTLRMQLVGSVLLLITPAWLLMYIFKLEFSGFVVGLLALAAAWFGGEHFIMHQVRALSDTAQKITDGDLSARTGLKATQNELGQLTKLFDQMAESLERYVKNLESAEKNLLNRSFQQTVVAALGQFALTNSDLEALMNQAAMLVAQTLSVEYSGVFERLPAGQLRLQSGV